MRGIKQAGGESQFLYFVYRIVMLGNPHSEKADEKPGRVENHTNDKGKCFSWRDGGFHLFSLSTRKARGDSITVYERFPRQKIVGSHHFSLLAEKDNNRIQWLKAGAKFH